MLVCPGHIIQHDAAAAGAHDDIAHFHLQRVRLQENGFFLRGELLPFALLLLRRFALLLGGLLRVPGIDRQFNGALLLCHPQAGDQLLIDLGAGLYAAQERHRVMDDGRFIVQRPGRVFLAVAGIRPGLGQELRESVAQAPVVEYDPGGMREPHIGFPHLLRQRVQALSVIGAHIHLLFQEKAIFHFHQLDHADHRVVRLPYRGRGQVNAHHIIRRAAGRLGVFHLAQGTAGFRQVIGEGAARLRADKDAAVFHGELGFRHFLLFLTEEFHVRDPHPGSASVIQRAGKGGGASVGEIPQGLHEHGIEIIAFQAGGGNGHRFAGIIRHVPLVADIPLGVFDRRDDRVQVVCLDLRAFVDDHDLSADAAHGPHGKAFDLGTVFQRTDALVPGQLYRPMPVRLDLAHDLRVADEVILNLLDNLCSLLRCARHHGDEAAGVLHADGNAAQRHQPGFSIAAGLDHHLCVAASELPGHYLLGVLQPDAEIAFDENVQVIPPE